MGPSSILHPRIIQKVPDMPEGKQKEFFFLMLNKVIREYPDDLVALLQQYGITTNAKSRKDLMQKTIAAMFNTGGFMTGYANLIADISAKRGAGNYANFGEPFKPNWGIVAQGNQTATQEQADDNSSDRWDKSWEVINWISQTGTTVLGAFVNKGQVVGTGGTPQQQFTTDYNKFLAENGGNGASAGTIVAWVAGIGIVGTAGFFAVRYFMKKKAAGGFA